MKIMKKIFILCAFCLFGCKNPAVAGGVCQLGADVIAVLSNFLTPLVFLEQVFLQACQAAVAGGMTADQARSAGLQAAQDADAYARAHGLKAAAAKYGIAVQADGGTP